MLDDYISNLENIVSNILFASFKSVIILLTMLLIISLILLAIGCLIKSQKIKAKFLSVLPKLLILIILFLSLPCIFAYFMNFA